MVSQSEVADTFPVRIYWDTVEPKLLVCELCPLSEQRRALEAMAEASGVALRNQPAAGAATQPSKASVSKEGIKGPLAAGSSTEAREEKHTG